jgi:hypothetical protein
MPRAFVACTVLVLAAGAAGCGSRAATAPSVSIDPALARAARATKCVR